jgi:hypothetical protein
MLRSRNLWLVGQGPAKVAELRPRQHLVPLTPHVVLAADTSAVSNGPAHPHVSRFAAHPRPMLASLR